MRYLGYIFLGSLFVGVSTVAAPALYDYLHPRPSKPLLLLPRLSGESATPNPIPIATENNSASPMIAANHEVSSQPTISKELTANASLNSDIDTNSPITFGSAAILNACWTPEQLKGSEQDRIIHKIHDPADKNPPTQLTPINNPLPLPNRLKGSIRQVIPDPTKKLVALTFDLCEGPNEHAGYEASIINYLRENHIPATFYAGGKWMRSHPDKTKQLMADPLFEIGNHTWTHGNMRRLTGEKMREQVLWTQAEYEIIRQQLQDDLPHCGVDSQEIKNIPPIPFTFRYPYGVCSPESLGYMQDYGLPSIQWNIVTADPWKAQTAERIAKTILQEIKPGSIIVAHANGRGWKTAEALDKFIPQLKAQGYEFVNVTKLLAEGKQIEAADSCYELKPGDNLRYDHIGSKTN